MRKLLGVALIATTMTGCMTIPSFYDDNESMLSIGIRKAVKDLDCSQPQHPQAVEIYNTVDTLLLYSESKGSTDVAEMVQPLEETAKAFVDRTVEKDASATYCKLKKKAMSKQSSDIAGALMWRY